MIRDRARHQHCRYRTRSCSIRYTYCCSFLLLSIPFRTAVPFWGQTTSKLTGLSSKRDCGSKRVEHQVYNTPAPGTRRAWTRCRCRYRYRNTAKRESPVPRVVRSIYNTPEGHDKERFNVKNTHTERAERVQNCVRGTPRVRSTSVAQQ